MQPVVDLHDRIVRWRQLVDLLSRLPESHDEAIVDAGFALIEREAPSVPEEVRAAAARNVAGRPAVYRMVAMFARDTLAVAAPVLASAHLGANEWARIARDCNPEVGAFIQTLVRGGQVPRDPRDVLPERETSVPAAAFDGSSSDESPSISQMVARIEQLRSRRAADDEAAPSTGAGPPFDRPMPPAASRRSATPAAASGSAAGGGMFRWESDPGGQIAWVEGVPRGAFVGGSVTTMAPDASVAKAMDARAPFHNAAIQVDAPAIEGEWRLSGLPTFSPSDGRFLGYRGIAQRQDSNRPVDGVRTRSAAGARHPSPRSIDSLRETIHEIKTPLNAIIGFAEIIDGQYLGPAHRNYRLRAAQIVTQARTLLEAIQDMEYAARFPAGEGEASRLVDVFATLENEVQAIADRQAVSLSIIPPARDLACSVNVELARRLVKRFIVAAIEGARPTERLVVDVAETDRQVLIGITRPSSTMGLSEAILLNSTFGGGDEEQPILGLGFALRLVRGLGRLVDGDVEIAQDRFLLRMPAR